MAGRRGDLTSRVWDACDTRQVEVTDFDAGLQVRLAVSGRTVTVAADESALDAANRAGASCCRPAGSGRVLSPEERRESEYTMTCLPRFLCASWTPGLQPEARAG